MDWSSDWSDLSYAYKHFLSRWRFWFFLWFFVSDILWGQWLRVKAVGGLLWSDAASLIGTHCSSAIHGTMHIVRHFALCTMHCDHLHCTMHCTVPSYTLPCKQCTVSTASSTSFHHTMYNVQTLHWTKSTLKTSFLKTHTFQFPLYTAMHRTAQTLTRTTFIAHTKLHS